MTVIQLFIPVILFFGNATKNPDAIVGKWESVENNVIVEVFKVNSEYKAKLVWFRNTKENVKPSATWVDEKNPNIALRERKLLGMEVLQHMVYNPKVNRWDSGKVYDCTTGKEWSSSAWLAKDNLLNLRGFWQFEFLGKNMLFKKLLSCF